MHATAVTPPAGFRLNDWLRLVGYGRSTYYSLPPELKPASVKIGAAVVIIEAPVDYLARLAARQIEAATS